MGLSEYLMKKRYKPENYRKYVTNANEAFMFMTAVEDFYGKIDDCPKFLVDVYLCTLFLCDALNSSIYLFFYDENHNKYKDRISDCLKRCGLDDVANIYDLIYINLANLPINYSLGINYFKENAPLNVKYNINLYEEELVNLHGENALIYERLDKYLKEELNKN